MQNKAREPVRREWRVYRERRWRTRSYWNQPVDPDTAPLIPLAFFFLLAVTVFLLLAWLGWASQGGSWSGR